MIARRFFHKLVAPVLAFLPQAVAKTNSDWHYRKFFTKEHLLTLIYHQLSEDHTLRAVEEARRTDEKVQEAVESSGVHLSNLGRANQNRSYKVFRYLFHALFPVALACCGVTDLGTLFVVGSVKIMDATFIECVASMLWAEYKTKQKGVKGHVLFDLGGIPERLVLTSGKGKDRTVLAQSLKRGVTYLFDRGYNCYAFFATMCELGAYFVTRLCANAVYEVVTTFTVEADSQKRGVLSDQKIRLGQGKTRIKPLLRLITFQDATGKVYHFLTNRFDLPAWVVCELYHRRWDIELFFRWIKSYLKVKQFIGRSRNAVLCQLFAALITFLLLKIHAKKEEAQEKLTRTYLRGIKHRLFNEVSEAEVGAYLAGVLAVNTS
jgi:hypothetical protein